jgi:lysozyme family protein
MKYIKLANIALFLDSKGFYKKADLITRNLTKLSKEDAPPFELKEGESFNDPDTVMKYFIGFAFDMYSKDKNISKKKINQELKKKISDKISEMSSENKQKFSNLESDVMAELVKQSWYPGLQDSYENNENKIKFDSNSSGFQNAIKYILDVEGGYSDYNSSTGDPRTNLGIIQSEYDKYRSSKGLPPQSVKNITQDEAEEIYFVDYWVPTGCEQIYKYLPKTAITIFDFAVNSGLGGASSVVASALDIPKGRFDSSMINSIIKIGTSIGDDTLFKNLVSRRRINYKEIIKRKPRKAVYGPGWQNRLDKLENFNQSGS